MDLGAQAVAIVRQDKLLWVATMDKTVSCYTGKSTGEMVWRGEEERRGEERQDRGDRGEEMKHGIEGSREGNHRGNGRRERK